GNYSAAAGVGFPFGGREGACGAVCEVVFAPAALVNVSSIWFVLSYNGSFRKWTALVTSSGLFSF
ncbi:MAG TPA: hypothetical protein VK518_14415, partial [Puia sp.]|nr:hypothetical protein [Puia sp.]